MITEAAVEAAFATLRTATVVGPLKVTRREMRAALDAAAPHMAAQALSEAVDAFPLETITAPDNAVVWLMRRAEEMRPRG